jgi:hypothetical protein
VDQRALVALIVKTAGLVLIVYTLALSPDRIASYLFSEEQSGSLFLGLVLFPLAVPSLIGAFLLVFPATTASAVVGTFSADSSDLERVLQAVVFGGIGLYLALQGSLDLAYYAARHAYGRDQYAVDALAEPTTRASLVSSIVSLLLGVALLLGARGFSALVIKLRYRR